MVSTVDDEDEYEKEPEQDEEANFAGLTLKAEPFNLF